MPRPWSNPFLTTRKPPARQQPHKLQPRDGFGGLCLAECRTMSRSVFWNRNGRHGRCCMMTMGMRFMKKGSFQINWRSNRMGLFGQAACRRFSRIHEHCLETSTITSPDLFSWNSSSSKYRLREHQSPPVPRHCKPQTYGERHCGSPYFSRCKLGMILVGRTGCPVHQVVAICLYKQSARRFGNPPQQ